METCYYVWAELTRLSQNEDSQTLGIKTAPPHNPSRNDSDATEWTEQFSITIQDPPLLNEQKRNPSFENF